MNKNKFNSVYSSEELRDVRLTGWEDAADYAPDSAIVNVRVGDKSFDVPVRNQAPLEHVPTEGPGFFILPDLAPQTPDSTLGDQLPPEPPKFDY